MRGMNARNECEECEECESEGNVRGECDEREM